MDMILQLNYQRENNSKGTYWVLCTYCFVLSTMYVYSAPYWYWLNSYMYIIIQRITSYNIFIYLFMWFLSTYLSIVSTYSSLDYYWTVELFKYSKCSLLVSKSLYLWVYRVFMLILFSYYDCAGFLWLNIFMLSVDYNFIITTIIIGPQSLTKFMLYIGDDLDVQQYNQALELVHGKYKHLFSTQYVWIN